MLIGRNLKRQLSDPFEFARSGGELDGEVNAREFEHLADVLRPTADIQPVRFRLIGQCVKDKNFIRIELSGELSLNCQRCLGELQWPIKTEGRLLLVPRGAPLPDDELEDDSFDAVHAGSDFDVLAVVEEELLLALPFAPVHENCDALKAARRDEKESPFAVLKQLKQAGDD